MCRKINKNCKIQTNQNSFKICVGFVSILGWYMGWDDTISKTTCEEYENLSI